MHRVTEEVVARIVRAELGGERCGYATAIGIPDGDMMILSASACAENREREQPRYR